MPTYGGDITMRILRRELAHESREDVFEIIPIGDIHIGSAAVDEKLLRNTIEYVASDPNRYWIGMGDYCDFINLKDKRFDPTILAPWITTKALADIAGAQIEYATNLLKPIAHKCLALVEGNHETSVKQHYERDVYREIGIAIKMAGEFPQDHNLLIGYYGWLRLVFKRGLERNSPAFAMTINLHHGFGGGKMKGGKALNMERWIWTHDADVIIFGHTHNSDAFNAPIEMVDKNLNHHIIKRYGVYSGTYLRTNGIGFDTYSERAGYLPLSTGGVVIRIRPGAMNAEDRIRIIT